MMKLINIVPNSNFEHFEYSNSSTKPNTIKIKDWTVTNEDQINGLNAYNGAYSLALKKSEKITKDDVLTTSIRNYNPRHHYYFRVYFKTNGSQSFEIQIKNQRKIIQTLNLKDYNYPNWDYVSYYFETIDDNDIYEDCDMTLQQTSDNSSKILIDSIMLLDLTETFGSGYEPSKEWCDKNIPYFEKDYDVELLSKEIEFTCKDQFVYDNDTKKYYTDNYSPKITFVIKNVDKNYNTNKLQDVLNKIRLDYTTYNKLNEITFNKTLTIDDLTAEYIGNDCYITYTGFNFEKYRHHAKLEIYSDLSNGTRVKDELTIYFIGKYDTEDNLQFNLDFDLSYSSTYLRKLKGTTNAYIDVPMNIDVFINGVKTSPVNILNQDDKLTVFEKDLYLSDGENTIKVVVTDICGNQQMKETKIYVDCMTPKPEKENLLENFVADDDLKISLHLGNSNLEYETNSAGLNKNVLIDTTVNSHYFKLEGENANLYRISKDNIPLIQGDIIKRPLAITFDYVEKIYDGTNDISLEVRKLKLDDGYYLHDIHKEYNDFANSGFVRGTSERKVTSETIFKQYDYISNEYIIDKTNVDYSNFYINIDGVEGYSLLDKTTGNATIIFNSPTIHNKILKVELIKKIIDNDKLNRYYTILKFTHVNDLDLYRVVNNVNIKYNYSNDSGLEYITYKTSDKGLVQVDFSKAFFKSKDVTDSVQPITLNDIKFIGDTLGDASGNYQISNYVSTGKILRRTINPHIECLDKIYDGSPIVPFKMSDKFYNGLENAIENDDVFIDNTYEGNKDDEFHIFTKSGSTVLVFEDANVGEDKLVNLNSIFLEGHDAKNYKIGEITSNYKASILSRPIEVIVNKIRLIRATRTWEIDYTFLNNIKEDKITICYNTNDNLDIKVYGGIDNNGNSIHKNDNVSDIRNMFFNYPFTTEYQFKDINTEVKLVTKDNNTAYWLNEVRDAEPDTERIDVIVEANKEYPGEVKLTLDTISNGVQTSYFESENKDYKLYSGCKVMIKNINLNPLNDKSKNYTLLNSTCETEIEII